MHDQASTPPGDPSPAESLFAQLVRSSAGASPSAVEGLCAEHPELAEELRDLHAGWVFFHELLTQVSPASLPPVAPHAAPTGSAHAAAEPARRVPAAGLERRSRLGRGGMGEVFEAWDPRLRRTLAMKTLHDGLWPQAGDPVDTASENFLQRFLEEAQVTAQLDHPGVVPVHDLDWDAAGRPFFTMARVQGNDLHIVLRKLREGEDGWNLTRLLGVLQRVCETMAYAHSKGVVHRDLKPANVMVGAFGEVYVMDWGLAKVLARGDDDHDALRPQGAAAPVRTDRSERIGSDPASPLATLGARQPGTVFYMSPEQAAGRSSEIGPSTDVYALGAMLYETLTGNAPYRRQGLSQTFEEVRDAILAGPPTPIEQLASRAPAELVAIAEKAMAEDRSRRYTDMRELGDDLRAYLEGRVVRAHRTGAWAEARKWVLRNKGWAASIAAALVVLLGLWAAYSRQLAVKKREIEGQNLALERKNLDLAAETARANEATTEARQRLAGSLVREAAIAGTRGRWRDVLGLVAQAREAGFPDEVALELEEARAHVALMERARAREIVEALAQREDLGKHRGRVLLMQGDLALRETDDSQAALALVRSALEKPLLDADRAYAEGLLAETTPEALAAFERALEQDPFHFRALGQALQIEMLLGRFEDAALRERAFRELCPADPMPDAVAALVAGLAGDRQRASTLAEEVRSKSSDVTGAAMDALIAVAAELHAGCTLERLIGANGLPIRAPNITAYITQLTSIFRSLPIDALLLPSVRAGLGAARDAILGVAFAGLIDYATLDDRLERGFTLYPDGALLFLHGGHAMNAPIVRPSSNVEKLRRAEEFYRRAADMPSLFPDLPRAARYFAAYAQALLASRQGDGDEAARARLVDNVFRLADSPDLIAHECSILSQETLREPADPLLSLVLVRRWQEFDQAGPERAHALARALIALGAYEPAVRAANDALARDPGDAVAAGLRRQALETAERKIWELLEAESDR